MADIDQIIAGGAGAGSRYDFSTFGDPVKSFYDAQKQSDEAGLRRAFRDGVPTTADGQPDFGAMAKTLFQKGGLSEGTALTAAAVGPSERAKLDSIDGPATQPAPIVSPPSSNRGASTPVAPPLNRGGETAQSQPQGQPQAAPQGGQRGSPQGDQPGSIVGLVSAAGIPDELAGPVIQQISALTKSDPNASLDPTVAARVQQVVQAAAQRMKAGQPQGGAAPAPAPVQQPPHAPHQAPLQASPAQQDAQNDPILKRLTFLAGSPDKATAAAAKVRLESYLKSKESTTEMKNAAASGMTLPQYQEKQGELASQQAGATERAKADVKEQQEYIDAGRAASQRLTTLNAITNVASSDKNVSFGFGADTELKVKMGLERLGFNFGDLSGSQLIQKMNASLASEMAKSLTGRPTQFEFKTFLANNPGLLLDKTGTIRLASIFSQLSKREYELGKLARQNGDNWQNWDNVVEKYDAAKDHQIVDPVSKQPIYTNSIVSPGSGPKEQAANASPQFSSPADVHAAVAAGKLKSGDPFLTPDGKTKYVP